MANHTERIGVYHCAEIAEANNWLFREQPVNDIGIDAHMEYIESSGKPKQLIAIQIKSGSSWFKEVKDGDVIFRGIKEHQYNYWTSNSLPCIVVLYNPDDKTCIWQKLTTDTLKRASKGEGNGFYVRIPRTQIFLDTVSNKMLLSFSNLPEYVRNYNFLLSQIEFMRVIHNGGIVKLHSREWVNKSSGKGETELIVDDGNSITEYPYPYWFPYTLYTDVFPKLFPWANFTVDEDFYEENDRMLWQKYCCYYDDEDDEWINVGDNFDDFRLKLSPIRSIDIIGEVAEYMLVLSLNDLGKSFLTVNRYTSENQSYTDVRPLENEKM